MSYINELDRIAVLDNKWQEAVNQTELYRLICDHFYSPLPKGKKVKKAIVIGYDGCTAEMLNNTADVSAIRHLLSDGGHGIFSYAGGRPYPEELMQETSTAPGWCSMLTGTLADFNGIDDNGIVKEIEPKTLFIKLIEDGAARSCGFYVSWGGHFVDGNSTYLKEKEYIEANGLSASYICADDDDGTCANTLGDIAKPDCSDFIFTILEYTDHTGHRCDYRSDVREYVEAFNSAEKAGESCIKAIESRPSYSDEDWLILITSDHGGFERGHGGPTLQERITFIISNKEGAK
jgi:predicted AlkP superfamily pyrophosphatase or phosphodiesterase